MLEHTLPLAREVLLELADDCLDFIKSGYLPLATGQNIKRIEEAHPKIFKGIIALRELASELGALEEKMLAHALEIENARAKELTPEQFEDAMKIGTPVGSA